MTLAYVGVAWLGLRFATLHRQASPVWPATGLAIAACCLWGRRVAPAIWLGAWIVNLQASGGWLTSAVIALGNTSEALVGAFLCHTLHGSRHDFAPRAPGTALAVSALFSSPISATIGGLTLVASGQLPWARLPATWVTWWMGDLLGALVMTPVVISLARRLRAGQPAWMHRWPALRTLVELSVFAVLTAAVLSLIARHGTSYLFLLFPLLLLCAARFGELAVKLLALALYVYFCVETRAGAGPFVGRTAAENLTHLQLFLAGLLLTSNGLADFAESSALSLATPLLLGGWLIAAVLLHSFHTAEERRDQLRLASLVQQIEIGIQHRMQEYEQVLLGAVGLHAASRTVSAHDWRTYIETLSLRDTYPGLHGVGVIRPVARDRIEEFQAEAQALGVPALRVHGVQDAPRPEATRDLLYIIQLLEPGSINQAALGLDIASESTRRLAADLARDSGRPALSGRISLVQDHEQRPGFLLLYPMYRRGLATDTVDARRAACSGWVYAPFVAQNWLDSVLAPLGDELTLLAFSGPAHSLESLLYRSDHASGPLPSFDRLSTIELAQQTMTLAFRKTSRFESSRDTTTSWVAACAALVTLLLAGLVVNLQQAGRHAHLLVAERTEHLNEALAAAERASRVKSQFLANMSHEIRTPLNGILGMSSLMLSSPLSPEQRELARILKDSSSALLAIVNDILDFSKIEAGKLVVVSEPFSLRDCAYMVLALFRSQAEQKGLTLQLHIPLGSADWILGDVNRYRQVLTNLVHNAIKFTAQGKIDVTLSSQPQPDDRILCTTEVRDTGIGISPAVKARLFQPFSQGDESTTRPYGGTGLGLSISRALVQAMGGEIDCDSQPGQGARFWFSIRAQVTPPLVTSPTAHSVAAPTQPAAGAAAAPPLAQRLPLRILVADDQEVNQLVARRFLEKLGYAPDSATNGNEVLVALGKQTYDVIFMDCHMPELDGYAAAERIGQLYPEAQRPKIIAMTASTLAEDREHCARVGMVGFVDKPIRIDQLASALQKLFPVEKG